MNGWLIQQLINNTNYRQFLTCNIMQCTTVKLLCWPFHSRFQLVWKTYICLWSAKMINWCTYCCGSFLQIGNSSCGKWNMATFHPVGLGWGVVSNVHFMTWSSFLELMSSWHMQKIFSLFYVSGVWKSSSAMAENWQEVSLQQENKIQNYATLQLNLLLKFAL